MAEAKKEKKEKFDPSKHLTDIHDKPYLQVMWRLVWFREDHPDWTIKTMLVERGAGWALMRAEIIDGEKLMASAHKAETKVGFGDYLEKAETGAVGRALAMCGYGTQFAPDLEEGTRLADAPVAKQNFKFEGKPKAKYEMTEEQKEQPATATQKNAIVKISAKTDTKLTLADLGNWTKGLASEYISKGGKLDYDASKEATEVTREGYDKVMADSEPVDPMSL